jgi:hypothetical protein
VNITRRGFVSMLALAGAANTVLVPNRKIFLPARSSAESIYPLPYRQPDPALFDMLKYFEGEYAWFLRIPPDQTASFTYFARRLSDQDLRVLARDRVIHGEGFHV